MYIALKTFGLLAGGGYHSSTTVNGVRWCSTFWSRSTWKHFAYVFFKVSIYTWVEHNHQVLDFSRVPFVRLHLNSLCFYHFVLEAHVYRNHLTDTLIGSHSCLSGVEFKSVNLNWNKKKSRNKNYWDQRSSLVENWQLLNIVSPKHRNLTKDSSGLGFCARKNMHLIFLKDVKKLLPSNCRDWYFAHTLQSRCDCYYQCSFMFWGFFTSEDSRKWETKCWENIKAEGGSSVITHTCLLGSDSCTYLATGTCCSCKREVRYIRVPSVPRKMQVSNSGSAAPFRPPTPNMVLLFLRSSL